MESLRPPRAALYARVSTVAHGQDVGLQLDELRAVALQRGWSSMGEYVDHCSGSKASRPALDQMMEDIRAGKVDVVAVWRFDRFARSSRHLVVTMAELRERKIDFVSLREQVDTATPIGRAVFTIIAAIAELERDLIRERVVAGVRRAQAAGVHCGRRRKDVNAQAVHAARVLLDQGWTWREVAKVVGVPHDTLRRRLREAEAAPGAAAGIPDPLVAEGCRPGVAEGNGSAPDPAPQVGDGLDPGRPCQVIAPSAPGASR